jgi:hypothetical protein
VRCDEALEAISAAVDGELIDHDGTVRAALDEHLTGCDDCRDFQSYTVELRARLRFEAVDAAPDVASGVIVAVRERLAEEAARAEAEGEGGAGGDDPAVAPAPLWRRARSVLRPTGRSGRSARTRRPGRTGPGRGAGTSPATATDVLPRTRPLTAAVAAALVTGMIVGAAFVGVGHETTPTAWAEDLPQQVVEAQRDITSLEARVVVTERGRPDHAGERRFTGLLSYEAPERLALELTEDVDRGTGEQAVEAAGEAADPGIDQQDDGSGSGSGDDGALGAATASGWSQLRPGEGDVHLLVRDDRWWLETVRSCTEIAGETSCPTGGARWTLAVTGREAFSDAAPIPLELIGAVDSFTLAAAPPVLGERRIAGRDAVGVRVPAAQVSHFLAALSPGGDLRSVHPGDPVDVWLDRDDLVPLAVDVTAGPSDERAAWATANDFREQPGDTVLSFSVVSIAVNEAVPDAVFEWTGDEADTTITERSVSGDGDLQVRPESLDPGAAGEDDAGLTDDTLPPPDDPAAAGGTDDVGDPGDLDGDGADDPVGGAVLPTSTPTAGDPGTPGIPPEGSGRSRDLDGPAGDPVPLPTTTDTLPTSTTLPVAPDDPPSTTTTTTATTTTLPPSTTTTTTVLGDGGLGEVVEPPVDDDPGADSDDGVSAMSDGTGALGADLAAIDHLTSRDEGFRTGDAGFVPEPSRLPEGMERHVSGTIQSPDGPTIGVRSWTDGRAWTKVRATDGWDGPRLFGELGDAVRQVDLGDGGQGYVSADGRKVALHTDDLDLVVCGSLPTEQLVEIAGSLGVVGEPVPADWPESGSATIEEAQQAQPGLLVPRSLDGFGPPAVGIGNGSVSQLYAGPGDRTFTLTRSDTPVLAPPAGEHSFGVEVRDGDGRYDVSRGELEWTEDGAAYSLLSRTISLSELLAIAATLAPLPTTP